MIRIIYSKDKSLSATSLLVGKLMPYLSANRAKPSYELLCAISPGATAFSLYRTKYSM
jgi:hypothetical protein